jgi:lysophospholipid hydrolase
VCGRWQCPSGKQLLNPRIVPMAGVAFVTTPRLTVQFAPSNDGNSSSSSPIPGSRSSFNGYHLLNEVSTGGTLSSLLSILTLFTEDIKLSYTTPPETDSNNEDEEDPLGDQEEGEMEADTTITNDRSEEPGSRPNRSRANSDVSQLAADTLGSRVTSPTREIQNASPVKNHERKRASSVDGSETTAQDRSASPRAGTSTSLPATKSPSPVPHLLAPDLTNAQTSSSAPVSPRVKANDPSAKRPIHRENSSKPKHSRTPKPGLRRTHTASKALEGTIARATVDTTLAVIPAEAFKKLTRKFPKASGTVVQVVLERFSRVTFMTGKSDSQRPSETNHTAHKYLGLTREILKSETALNKLVSHPLPPEFYTGGGMNALRRKFHPEQAHHHHGHANNSTSAEASPMPGVHSRDYFNYVPASPTVRAPSLPSITPRMAMSPLDAGQGTKVMDRSTEDLPKLNIKESQEGQPSVAMPTAAAATFSPDTAARHSSKFVRRTSAMRKQVAAGDLAMSHISQADENGGAYYRPSAQTPGLPRMDTWRGRIPSSTIDLRDTDGMTIPSPIEDDEADLAELRDLVLLSIARSIGLAQTAEGQFDSLGRSSIAPSVSALSTPNSPMFPPNTRTSRSPFGNVLDMMNASTQNDSMIGGMLREAAMHARQAEDDMSSISASVHDSVATGHDVNRAVLRDLEGNVDILFFKQGSTLVKEGERSPGIYFVIDGFLDVSWESFCGLSILADARFRRLAHTRMRRHQGPQAAPVLPVPPVLLRRRRRSQIPPKDLSVRRSVLTRPRLRTSLMRPMSRAQTSNCTLSRSVPTASRYVV